MVLGLGIIKRSDLVIVNIKLNRVYNIVNWLKLDMAINIMLLSYFDIFVVIVNAFILGLIFWIVIDIDSYIDNFIAKIARLF